MSKKTLLNESTVRQFMKYANLGGLTDNFINETYMKEEEVEEGKRGKRRPTGPKKEGEKPLEEGEMEEGHEEGHMAEEEQVDEVAPIVATGLKLGAQALKNPAVRKAGAAALKGAVGSMMGGDEKNEGHHMEEGEMEEGSHLGEIDVAGLFIKIGTFGGLDPLRNLPGHLGSLAGGRKACREHCGTNCEEGALFHRMEEI